jgi:hypothetical protein
MATEVGHGMRAGIKQNTGTWGTAVALALGANEGFEFNSESLKANSELIKNEGLYGSPYARPGSPGNLKPGGDMSIDMYYNCQSLKLLAQAHGTAGTPTTLVSGAYRHDLILANTHLGKHFTLALLGAQGVREFAQAKVVGVKIAWDEGSQRVKMTPAFACCDEILNVGTANVAFVVASVAAANGTLTILGPALVDFNPTPLSITKVAGITAITYTIVAVDRRGNQVTKVVTETDFVANFWSGTEAYRRVISITVSNLAGTGNHSVGVTNGINNETNRASVTTVATRDPILFNQVRVYVNAQGGADFVAADEQYIAGGEVSLSLNMDSRVTSQFGYRIEEPMTGGAGRCAVGVSLKHSALTDRNRSAFVDSMSKDQKKVKVVFTGPQIGATAYAHSLTFWLNGVQFREADPNIGGPGVLPFDVTGEAAEVTAVPTGFPASDTYALMTQIQNALATAMLA